MCLNSPNHLSGSLPFKVNPSSRGRKSGSVVGDRGSTGGVGKLLPSEIDCRRTVDDIETGEVLPLKMRVVGGARGDVRSEKSPSPGLGDSWKNKGKKENESQSRFAHRQRREPRRHD